MSLNTVSRIRVTLEIVGSSYGTGWKVEDIFDQASKEAIQHLRTILKDRNVEIIGVPEVKAVIASNGN